MATFCFTPLSYATLVLVLPGLSAGILQSQSVQSAFELILSVILSTQMFGIISYCLYYDP
jgi:hypothetical protein